MASIKRFHRCGLLGRGLRLPVAPRLSAARHERAAPARRVCDQKTSRALSDRYQCTRRAVASTSRPAAVPTFAEAAETMVRKSKTDRRPSHVLQSALAAG